MEQLTESPPEFKVGGIQKAIISAMKNIDKITKTRKSDASTGGYSFRGIDDVYNELHDVLAEAGIFSTCRILKAEHVAIKTSSGKDSTEARLTVRWYFWAEDGSYVCHDTEGVGRDTQDKAANKAMSVGHKYALIQILAIPTADAKDPEDARHDAATEDRRPAPQQQRPGAQQQQRPAPAQQNAPKPATPPATGGPGPSNADGEKLAAQLDAAMDKAADKAAVATVWADVMKAQKQLTPTAMKALRDKWQAKTKTLGA